MGGSAFGFIIEGVGVAGTVRTVMFANAPAPSWDSDGAWIDCIKWRSYPGQLGSSISFYDGSGSVGSMAFEVIASKATSAGVSVEDLLTTTTPLSLGKLDGGGITATDPTIGTTNINIAGKVVQIKRECILLGTHTGSGTYNGCTRGTWGTRGQAHAFGEDDFITLYDAETVPHIRWRRIQFFRVNLDTATSYSDISYHWTGVVDKVSAPSPGLIRLDCNALLDMIKPLKALTEPWRGEMVPQYMDMAYSGIAPEDAPEPPDSAFLGWLVQGDKPGQDSEGGAATLISVDGKAIVSGNPTLPSGGNRYEVLITEGDLYRFRTEAGVGRLPAMPSSPKRAWECYHCNGTVDNALPYSGNLATLFLQLMTTTAEGNNGSYDLGIAGGGIGVLQGLVDIAGIIAIRSYLGDLLDQDSLFLNVDKGDGVKVIEWFRGKLWCYGITVGQTNHKIAWSLLSDNDVLVSSTILEAEVLSPASDPPRDEPTWERVSDLGFDAVRAEYAYLPGSAGAGTISDTITDAQRRSVNIYGDQAAPRADLSGVSNPIKVRTIVAALIQLFHDDLARTSFSVRRSVGSTVDLGEQVKLTHSKIRPNGGGARGCTLEALVIESLEDDHSGNVTHLSGLLVGSGGSVIAPALVVDSYTSGDTVTFELDDSVGGFQSGDWTDYTTDLSDLASGDLLDHCDTNGVVSEAGLEIDTLPGSGQIKFTTTPATPPIAGDVFRVSDYDTSATRQQERYAYLADSNGTLGAAGAGKTYTAL